MSKTLLKKMMPALVLGIALLALGACASPSAQSQDEPFAPAASTIDKSGLYGAGESIEVGGIISGGRAQSNGNELSIGYPAITKSTSLPDGVSVSSFLGGTFDESSSNSMKEEIGAAPDSKGVLPAGFSYVLVREAITNTTGEAVSYDVSHGRFVVVDESGGISYVGTSDPLWSSAWDGKNLKQYWFVGIDAGATLEIKLLYVLPDDAIVSGGLAYLVDSGNATGKDGFVGLKAFDVAGQIQG